MCVSAHQINAQNPTLPYTVYTYIDIKYEIFLSSCVVGFTNKQTN